MDRQSQFGLKSQNQQLPTINLNPTINCNPNTKINTNMESSLMSQTFVSIVSDKLNFGLLMAASFLLGVILTSIVCCYRVKSTRRRGQKESQIMCGHGGGQQPPNQMTHVYQTHPISPPMAYGSPPPAYQSPFRPTNDPFVIQNAHFDRSMSVPYEPTFYSDPRMSIRHKRRSDTIPRIDELDDNMAYITETPRSTRRYSMNNNRRQSLKSRKSLSARLTDDF